MARRSDAAVREGKRFVYESQDADTSRFRDADEGCSDWPSEAGAAA